MFFDKCFNGTLQENDFEINSKQQKGSVRRKIKILSKAMNMPLLINDMQIEENLEKKKKKTYFVLLPQQMQASHWDLLC